MFTSRERSVIQSYAPDTASLACWEAFSWAQNEQYRTSTLIHLQTAAVALFQSHLDIHGAFLYIEAWIGFTLCIPEALLVSGF